MRKVKLMAAFSIGRLALRDAGVKPQVFLMNYRSQTSGMQPDYIVAIGAPFGMDYAEEYAVYDPPGKAADWNRPGKTILDGIGVRLAPGIHVPGK